MTTRTLARMAGMVERLVIPAADDFHVHLRQGAMMQTVVPHVRQGGCQRVYVMPNTNPPLTTAAQAVAYKNELLAVDPNVEYLMTLYLHESLTPAEIERAAKAGIKGVKSYPRGVTTNSESGIESYEAYYDVFRAMEAHGLVLNIHGEVPSDHSNDICVLNAEAAFLPHLEKLHRDFPRLKIVLEHATTAAAVEMVRRLGDTVAASITVHHLELVVDDWAGKPHHFCKPVAKFPHDRDALRAVVKEGHPRFFLGSDSAPHPRHTKETGCAHAGVYTSPFILPYLATILESAGCLDKLENFACHFGRKFYGMPELTSKVTLVREPMTVPAEFTAESVGTIVPFLAGRTIPWRME